MRKSKYSYGSNKLSDDLLDLRDSSRGRNNIMYLMIPQQKIIESDEPDKIYSVQNIEAAYPTAQSTREEKDNLLKLFLEKWKFAGKVEVQDVHPLWHKIIKNSWTKTYYRFDTPIEGSWVEVTTVKVEEVIKQNGVIEA